MNMRRSRGPPQASLGAYTLFVLGGKPSASLGFLVYWEDWY
jgi:hypothetical protein